MPATVRLGTCSWADEGLLKAWYPRGVSTPQARLRYYAERFDVVEVDSPFYALPEPDVTRPAVSQDLTLLKEAGLVDERRNGTRRLYRVRPEGMAEVRAFLEEFWDTRLDALKREAEREEREKDGHDRHD